VELLSLPQAVTERVASFRRKGARIGFVPTMGALHEGHLGLLRQAFRSCDAVVCSIFVNPLQFNDPKDLANYPRQLEVDSALLAEAGCTLLFAPEKEALFGNRPPHVYDLGGLDEHWEGPSRPGHFQGVVNVVERLFFHVRPDEAFFGEKDRQQLGILQHVARQLHWPERIVPCPTAREADGLAMSSRNMRLGPAERRSAPLLYKALELAARHAFLEPVPHLMERVQALLATDPLVELDHFGLAHPDTLQPLEQWEGVGSAHALIAARVGPVRLIDNLALHRDPVHSGKAV
jgi:pantoate--beta-alanine ligase